MQIYEKLSCQNNIHLPKLISKSFLKLIEQASSDDVNALKLQVIPSDLEKKTQNFESNDPLGECYYQVTKHCIHQYPNRILILTTTQCFSYCRYCFRRDFTSQQQKFISKDEFGKIIEYIKHNPIIKEVLLSGGDPLTGSFENLKYCFEKLRNVSDDLIIRLCTRAPIFAPKIFNNKYISLFKNTKPVWIIPHINHPSELGIEQICAIESCINNGIPMQSQSVLLKGVNDDADVLADLFHKLTCLGVKPGYLFQLDTAIGTSHFAVSFKDALDLWKQLKERLSGLSLPKFAVDLQDGGGKFPLSAIALHDNIISITDTGFKIKTDEKKVYSYKA